MRGKQSGIELIITTTIVSIELIITTTIVHACNDGVLSCRDCVFFLVFVSGDERHVCATCVCHCLVHFCVIINNAHSFFVFVSGDERRVSFSCDEQRVCVIVLHFSLLYFYFYS